jgi:ParB-like chromosome segregation protein Spo0J
MTISRPDFPATPPPCAHGRASLANVMQKRDSKTPSPRGKLAVVYRQIGDLKANERNARTHSPEQIRQIRRSIDEFGFNSPIALKDDDTTIGAGHGRWEAAKLDPPIDELPTVTLHGLTDSQWRAYVIADNKIALNSSWDEEVLRAELDALGADLELDLLGFDEHELSLIFLDREEGVTDVDAEWVGMPTFDQQDKTSCRIILVHFKEPADADAFGKLLGQPITAKTKSLWYPAAVIETTSDKRYVVDGANG